jgi:hypothetical protein
MAIGTWEDFTTKYGFQDGETHEDVDFQARNRLVKDLNKHKLVKAAKITVVPFDRPGIHNGCMLLVFPNPQKRTPAQLTKAWSRLNGLKEVNLPEGVDVSVMISEAYAAVYSARKPKPLLKSRELATVLAALRFWQESLGPDDEPAEAGDKWAEFFVEHNALSRNEIDSLCERLNVV